MLHSLFEHNQEALDSVIQAYKVAEDKRVLLPAMVTFEGFVLSHTTAPVLVPDPKEVEDFLPPYNPPHYVVNPKISETFGFGNIVWPWDTVHLRWDMHKAMLNAKQVIKKVAREYEERFGVYHGDLIKEYKTDDADVEKIVKKLNEMGHEVHIIRGERRIVLGVIGDVENLASVPFYAFKGVEEIIRIISARKANQKERIFYEQH